MKRNVINILLGFIALVAMSASCTKFLTEVPKTFDSPENYYTSLEEMQYSVNGCYDGLTCIFNGGVGLALNGHVFFEGLTGLCWREQSGGNQSMGFTLPLMKNVDGVNSTIWQYYYKSIENCNATIYGIENSTAAVAEADKNELLSEVYFLRAYYYWRLVSAFGPIPYKTSKTLGTDNAALPLNDEATVLDGCIADLLHAEELTEDNAWNRSDGHVSKGAIKSLLAKVYMQKAGYPCLDTKCYALAYDKAAEVVKSKAFSLFASYADLRNQGNENTGEFIFSIQRHPTQAGNPVVYCCLPLAQPAVTFNVNSGGGFVPNLSFYNSFEDGPRKSAFFYTEYPAFDGSGITKFEPHIFKFFDDSADALAKGDCGMDYSLIRYADVLLTMAEAKAQADGGKTTDAAALDAYWQVRSRAVPTEAKPTSITFADVFEERVKELAFENITWFDMTRTRKAYNPSTDKVVDIIGHTADGHPGYPFTEGDLYLPYPQREIKYNPNLVR